jgi:hypothetical protein
MAQPLTAGWRELSRVPLPWYHSLSQQTREELMRAFLLGLLLLATGPALAAEKFVGGNVDARTTLAFKAPDAAVRKVLPEGWDLDVANSGPAKDINLRLTFIDRLTAHDAEGKALDPVRVPTLSIPAKKSGSETRGTMLFLIYSSSAGGVPGPYGVSIQANTNMEKRVRIDRSGAATVEESWELQSQNGDSIQLQIQYVRGTMATGKAEQLMYSAAKPGFYRIYRSEQAVDIVRGPGADHVQKIVFKASGPKLAPLFDGSEQLIGVTSMPWYARQTYLPES